jgi:hypothetical protein
LDKHPPDLVAGGVDLNQVDTDDGQKIVGNIFGSNTDQVAQTIGGNLGGGRVDLIKKLLPLLAPIVLSYLSSRMRGGTTTGAEAPPSGGVGDLLGSILGSTGTGSSTSAGSVLDMLGGLLGGGRR